MRDDSLLLRIAVVCYRFLTSLRPRGWTDHPDDMVDDFSRVLRSEMSEGPRRGVAFLLGSLADALAVAGRGLIASLVREWRSAFAPSSGPRLAFRSLARTPGMMTLTVVTIAIGVGLTTVGFNVVYGVLLRPLPFSDPDQLVAIELQRADGRQGAPDFEALDLLELRERQSSFAGVDGYYRRSATLTDQDGYPRKVATGVVTATALSRLGVEPLLGRTFRPGEDFTGSIDWVVLGHDIWSERYAGDTQILGRTLMIDGQRAVVVGVMPEGFRFPVNEDMWVPMDFALPTIDRGSGRSFSVFGRLSSGVDAGSAETEVSAIMAAIAAENPETHPPLSAEVVPLADRHLPPGVRSMLAALLLALGAVFLIACANAGNLVLARSIGRRQEHAVRSALGGTHGHALGSAFAEALVLAVIGCGLGGSLAWFVMDPIQASLPDFGLPFWVDFSMGLAGLGLLASLGVIVVALCGTTAALQSAPTRIGQVLRQGSRDGKANGIGRAGQALVVVQIAMSFAVLVGGGLLFESLIRLRLEDRGYDGQRVLAVDLRLPETLFSNEERGAFFDQLLRDGTQLQGIEGVAIARGAPGTGPTFDWPFSVVGEPSSSEGLPRADGVPVSRGYFGTLDIELVEGRDFTPEESVYGSEPALIVNRVLAEQYLSGDAVGRRIQIGGDVNDPGLQVVGVVADTYVGSSSGGFGLRPVGTPQMYLSWGAAPYLGGTLLVRTEGPASLALSSLREFLQAQSAEVPLADARNLDALVVESTWAFGLFGSLFGGIGLAALVMAGVGLFGVLSFNVKRRQSEMGIRLALGANPAGIALLVVRRAAVQLMVGIALGGVLSLGIARSVRALLFGVNALDLSVYGTILGTMVFAAALAVAWPARTAARQDPAVSLDGRG